MGTNNSFLKARKLWLKDHQEFREQFVQDKIADDPSILGLGDLIVKDRERPQIGAGRLDLLLQEPDSYRRYEVEIQLGRTDESHIIRTIEYWDIERKRYPQYDHCAVIVAEEITSRFLNVIGLFNGSIPLIAIKMDALEVGPHVTLVFTTVLDERTLGPVDEDEETQEVTDRKYWEERGARETVGMADQLLSVIHEIGGNFELKYNKYYIGLANDGRANNFASFRPKKGHLNLEIKIPQSDELKKKLEDSGLDLLEYNKRWGQLRVRLAKGDLEPNRPLLTELLKQAYDRSLQ